MLDDLKMIHERDAQDALGVASKQWQQLQQTLRMFNWQMNEVMRSEGVNAVATVGEAFNPYLHEAIEAIENSDQPEGTIIEEARKGYTLGDETLRPARVKVSMGNK